MSIQAPRAMTQQMFAITPRVVSNPVNAPTTNSCRHDDGVKHRTKGGGVGKTSSERESPCARHPPPLLTFGDKSANYLTDKTYSLHFTETGAALVLFFFKQLWSALVRSYSAIINTRGNKHLSVEGGLQKVNLGDSFHKQ